MLAKITIGTLLVLALMVPAHANGNTTKKKIIVEREVVRVYEPRAVIPPEPLVALSILGTGLIISDNFDVDLFDIEERRRQHFRGHEFDRRRFSRERHRGRR